MAKVSEGAAKMSEGVTVWTLIYELRWQWWHRRSPDRDAEFLDRLYDLMNAERAQHYLETGNLLEPEDGESGDGWQSCDGPLCREARRALP